MIIIGNNTSHFIFIYLFLFHFCSYLFEFFLDSLLIHFVFLFNFYIFFLLFFLPLISSPDLLVNSRLFRDATDMRQDVATLLLLVQVETVKIGRASCRERVSSPV